MGYEFVWGLSHIGCELINYQPIFTETKKDTRGSESTKPEKKISILQIWDIAGHQPWPHWSSLLEYCFSEGRALRAHGNPSLEFLWEFTRREKVEISEMGNEWTRLLRWALAYIERWGGFKFENLPFFFFFDETNLPFEMFRCRKKRRAGALRLEIGSSSDSFHELFTKICAVYFISDD